MLCNEAEQMQQQIVPFVGGMNPLASSGRPSVMGAQRVAGVQARNSSSGGAAGRNKQAYSEYVRNVVPTKPKKCNSKICPLAVCMNPLASSGWPSVKEFGVKNLLTRVPSRGYASDPS